MKNLIILKIVLANLLVAGTIVTLQWTPSTTTNISGYNIYRANAPTQPSTPFTQLVSGVTSCTSLTAPGVCYYNDSSTTNPNLYWYYVTAVNTSSNESAPSNIVNVQLASYQSSKIGGNKIIGGNSNLGSNVQTPAFNLLNSGKVLTHNSFTPSGVNTDPGYIPGWPRYTITPTGFGSTTTYNAQGSQFGYCCPTPQGTSTPEAIYFPYAIVPNGASTFTQALHAAVAHGVVWSYYITNGVSGFNNPSNYIFQDLNTLSWYQKGVASCIINGTYPSPGYQNPIYSGETPCTPIVGAYVDGWIQGTQMFGSCGARSAPYCVLAMYDWSVGDITDTTGGVSGTGAWQLFTVPSENGSTTLGVQGYTGACSDGTYVYYPGLSNPADGVSGNTLRYTLGTQFANDPSKPGGIPQTGSTPNWANHNIESVANPQGKGFFGCRYDGHRFVYFFPTYLSSIVRYDTWGGGASPSPSAFFSNSNYVSVDMTTLGSTGPNYTGIGNVANLVGASGGGAIVTDSSGNQWIYAIPWSSSGGGNPMLASTTVRAKVGQTISSTWYCADFTQTSTDTLCPTVASAWEVFDLSTLQNNVEWGIATGSCTGANCNWNKTFTTGAYIGTSTMSGWQLSWIDSSNNLVYVSNAGNFFVYFNTNGGMTLYNPSAWSVGLRLTPPSNAPNSAFGGPFNSSTGCGMVSTPSTPNLMYCGL